MKRILSLSLGLLALCLAAPFARAASISITDLDGVLSIATDPFFEGGSTSNSTGGSATASGTWFSPGGSQNGSAILYWVSPTNPTVVEDIINVSFTSNGVNSTVNLSIVSDLNGALGNLPAGFTGFAKTGSTVEAALAFLDPATGAPTSLPPFLSVFLDGNISPAIGGGGAAVPVPAAFPLGIMMAGIVGIARRKFAKA